MSRFHRFLLVAVVCGIAIGGSLPRTAVARQMQIDIVSGPLDDAGDGWIGYLADVNTPDDNMTTWWNRSDDRTIADRLAEAGVPVPDDMTNLPVFMFKIEQGIVTEARVTRLNSALWSSSGTSLQWYGVVEELPSATFIEDAYASGGDSGLLFMLGRHRGLPHIDAFLIRIATGTSSIDDRKAAIYGLGAFASPDAQHTLLEFIRGTMS